MRLWRVGTNTLYILRTTGSWFVRFVVQPYIYNFQGSDMFILSRTLVRVKAIHPTTYFIGRGFLAEFYNLKRQQLILSVFMIVFDIFNIHSILYYVSITIVLEGESLKC